MTVRMTPDGTLELLGDCTEEDAESLQRHLLESPMAAVQWQGCSRVHAAVLQVLLAVQPPIKGRPAAEFLRAHVLPLLKNLQSN